MNTWVPEAAPDVREMGGPGGLQGGEVDLSDEPIQCACRAYRPNGYSKINTLNYRSQVFTQENLLLREFTLSTKGLGR
ncbi:MAG: hypothetical protein U5P10_17925 [Spirochaetia bacterium]|nr:hypothetical protein [Spirochaetia bacterium]